MDYAYCIIMLCLTGGILFYAGLIALFGFDMIPKTYSVRPKDKRRYATQFAKLLAIVAAAPAVSGLTSLVGVWLTGSAEKVIFPSLMVLVIALVVCIAVGSRLMKDVM